MNGQRKALIVASDQYDHEGLRQLLSPAADAEALARVLGDPQIGNFDVRVVHNETAHIIQAQIEDLFSDSPPDDLLLLHFSCHGLKSESGELFFAARNTRPNRLGSTAIPADFVQRCMRASRSRSVVLLLDCCYGGAFSQGVTVRASGDVNLLDSFPGEKLGGGRGRAVITASSSMEYAFEGDQLADDHSQRPSVFTTALVEGLATGEADRDEDGWVSLNELYDYVFDRVREQNPHQTPSRDVQMQGELYLARSQRRRIRPLPIPADLQAPVDVEVIPAPEPPPPPASANPLDTEKLRTASAPPSAATRRQSPEPVTWRPAGFPTNAPAESPVPPASVPRATTSATTPTRPPPPAGGHVPSSLTTVVAILVGIITLFLGLSALGNLDQDPNSAVTELYIQLIIYSVFRLRRSFDAGQVGEGRQTVLVVFGVLTLLSVLGLLAFGAQLTVFIAVFWLIAGVIDVFAALQGDSRPTQRWEIVSGALGALAGILATILTLSSASDRPMIITLGIWLILLGVLVVMIGLKQRYTVRRLAGPGAGSGGGDPHAPGS